MRMLTFAGRNAKEILRDPISLGFGVGFPVALILLLALYKLRTKDVQVMSQYNNGQITKEEAESVLVSKYGPAGE